MQEEERDFKHSLNEIFQIFFWLSLSLAFWPVSLANTSLLLLITLLRAFMAY